MNRRGFIFGALAAPAVIRTPGLIMPIKPHVKSKSFSLLHATEKDDLQKWITVLDLNAEGGPDFVKMRIEVVQSPDPIPPGMIDLTTGRLT